MNKLYKYLPFDINCIFGTNNDRYFKKDKIYSLNELLFNSNNYDLEGFNDFVEHHKVKPILRPFEDLTKELSLTKAAAEMIGMEECKVVISLQVVFEFINNHTDFKGKSNVVQYYIDNPQINSFEDLIWICRDNLQYSEFILVDERILDFLRAMHFAVDFKEDEYIKLEE